MWQKDGNNLPNKQYRRRLTLFGTASIIIILIFVYNLISYISLINKLENEEKDLQDKLVELKRDISNKKEEIDKLKDPDYLAKYAMEHFLYSKEGQYIIRIDENDNIILEMNEDKVLYRKKVIIILETILFILIVGYIIVKTKKRILE